MAALSSVLAWRIPGTVEPGGLPSMRSHRVEHDWSDLAAAVAETHIVEWKVGFFSYTASLKVTIHHKQQIFFKSGKLFY